MTGEVIPSAAVPRLSVQGVSKSFEAIQALRDVSFDLAPGEVHALVGENGAGKSTLVGIITGLRQPDAGRVLLNGTEVRFHNPLEARARGVAAVFQDPNLFPHLSIAENIVTGAYPRKGMLLDRAAMRKLARTKLEQLGFDLDPDRLVAELTVAEAQFVEIARAVEPGLQLLILDEPTSALTPSEAGRLYTMVESLKAAGTTVIWISHRMDEIRRLADTITVLRDGQHVVTAPAAELDDDAMIKAMTPRYPTLQIAFLRFFFGMAGAGVYALWVRPGWPTRDALLFNGLRALVITVVATTFFFALPRSFL